MPNRRLPRGRGLALILSRSFLWLWLALSSLPLSAQIPLEDEYREWNQVIAEAKTMAQDLTKAYQAAAAGSGKDRGQAGFFDPTLLDLEARLKQKDLKSRLLYSPRFPPEHRAVLDGYLQEMARCQAARNALQPPLPSSPDAPPQASGTTTPTGVDPARELPKPAPPRPRESAAPAGPE
ncbi:MAG: hypothetical protein GX442_24080 [Candidatus Riflebacteria bacterium]|nr:hypothetical protein [Candidatus Riflebacteria bacterium]